jgi:hypothetical protein
VPGYIIVQLIAATLACLFLWAVLGKIGMLGATEPGPGVSDWQAMLIELALTVGLVSTILGTASRAQNVGALSAVAVGGYIILAGLWSSPISGASMNPARSFGPDLALAAFSHYRVYVVVPVPESDRRRFAWVLRGEGGDVGGLAAGQGDLGSPNNQVRRSQARSGLGAASRSVWATLWVLPPDRNSVREAGPGQYACGRRGRNAGGVTRQADSQRARQRNEPQRWFERERLSIEADRNRRARADRELSLRPLEQAGKALRLADRLERDQLGDVVRTSDAGREDA